MANQKHLALLNQGATAWNTWRENHLYIHPDLYAADLRAADLRFAQLSKANLSGADLRLANLSDADLRLANLRLTDLRFANLSGSNLYRTDLSGSDLHDADLHKANLTGANLIGATLSKANLVGATLRLTDLSKADLSGVALNDANLSGANLSGANLSGANLSGARFYKVRLSYTTLAWVDLCTVEELDRVIHEGPSSIDVKTVMLPQGDTRTRFLRGAGFSDAFIDYLPSLLTAAIQFNSCFISYAHQDETLAHRLYKDLQDKGVRCWFAPHDLRPGAYFHRGIEDAIHFHEQVLLLLSEHAVGSSWIAHEVETALAREAREGRELLFPLCLDDTILHTQQRWAVRLRNARHIGDFTHWQDDTSYQQRLADLLRHLKVTPRPLT